MRDISFHYFVVHLFNSLALGRFGCNFKKSIFKLALLIGTFRASLEKVLRWMIENLTNDKSTFVHVMAWCCQATSHYLSQYWPRSMSPYGIIRPQWDNSLAPGRCGSSFKIVTSEHMLQTKHAKLLSSSSEITFRWMPQNSFEISCF